MSQEPELSTGATPEGPDGSSGVAPSGEGASASAAKVELDIDDAPFLEEPEEKPQEKDPTPEKPAPASSKSKEAQAASATGLQAKLQALLADKKKLAIAGGGLVFVLIVLPLLLLLLLGGKKENTPPPVVHEPERIVVSGVPKQEEAVPGPKFLYRLGGFFIEHRGSEGELRFVRASFAIPMDNPVLFAELTAKDVVIRDTLFYYLRNKPLAVLADPASRELLKADLLAVLNEHLSSDKVQELFFEEYLVTGG